MAKPFRWVVIVAIGLSLSACGRQEARVLAGQGSVDGGPSPDAIDDRDAEVVYEFRGSGINRLANSADAAVIGVFQQISGSRWNSNSGDKWPGDKRVRPIEYREATLLVEELAFDSPNLPVRPGETITVRLLGSGRREGQTVWEGGDLNRELDADDVLFGNRDGEASPGMRSFLLLGTSDGFPLEGGRTEKTVQLQGSFQGNWRIEDDASGQRVARSVDRRRDAPLEDVLNTIADERRRGLDEERNGTTTVERPFG